MKRWIWRHVELLLPDDWEMLRYTRNMQQGQCLFAGRYQIRMEFSWRRVPGPPDFERMMDDYLARLREAGQGNAAAQRVSGPPGWHGIEIAGDAAHSRFGTYLAQESLLIELVIFWPDGGDDVLLRTILNHVRVAARTDHGLRRWEASGVSCAVEPMLGLHACVFQPARAELVFVAPQREQLIRRLERLGMVDHWLRGSIEDWLSKRILRDTRRLARHVDGHSGHTFFRVTGRRRRLRMTLFGDRWMQVTAVAWRCPHDDRLYCSSVEYASRDHGDYQHPELMLSCCGAWKADGQGTF